MFLDERFQFLTNVKHIFLWHAKTLKSNILHQILWTRIWKPHVVFQGLAQCPSSRFNKLLEIYKKKNCGIVWKFDQLLIHFHKKNEKCNVQRDVFSYYSTHWCWKPKLNCKLNTHQNAIWLICASISDWQEVHMQKGRAIMWGAHTKMRINNQRCKYNCENKDMKM